MQDPEELMISAWTKAEFSSAMAIKLRTGAMTLEQRAAALSMFNRLATESFTMLTINDRHFFAAAKFIDRHELGLRSGDALHLAIAGEQRATVHTLDQRIANAGPSLGVPTELLS